MDVPIYKDKWILTIQIRTILGSEEGGDRSGGENIKLRDPNL